MIEKVMVIGCIAFKTFYAIDVRSSGVVEVSYIVQDQEIISHLYGNSADASQTKKKRFVRLFE